MPQKAQEAQKVLLVFELFASLCGLNFSPGVDNVEGNESQNATYDRIVARRSGKGGAGVVEKAQHKG